ncbi:hypothetical protein P154DRAFT_620936 [Amniculicola lignicola CBS 123094]|uniref:Uncharacterized protein n=1 Tax=Amniculicola lignicola CBS 123094 TaxID=1392246 RepID=A0A6A5WH94_9PLEO|nr:hypothetical protein P154DRAFT_620936 [Amniculicola lignicola CBS 123094]
MCYYRLYVFMGCGHTTSSNTPMRTCATIRSNQRGSELDVSKGRVSPTTLPVRRRDKPVSEGDAVEECKPSVSTSTATDSTFRTPNFATRSQNQKQDPILAQPCELRQAHPFLTYRLYSTCPRCTQASHQRLQGIANQHVKFEDWKWRVKYLSPVPEEARWIEWEELGGIGELMGSWVREWKERGDGLLGAIREGIVEEEERNEMGMGTGMSVGGVGLRGGMGSS